MDKKDIDIIDPIYEKFVRSIVRSLGSTSFYEFFMDAISKSDNRFQFSNRRVEKVVDTAWVDNIESSLKAFQHIIESPRNIIKEDEIIVNVANAKKTGSDVVRHLAQHTSLVEDFEEDSGNVRPSKLMQKIREDSTGIYENRLVFTTLELAHQFVKIRHDALIESMSDEFGAKLKINSDMVTATENMHMEMYMHIKDTDSALDTEDKNSDVFNKIAKIHRVLSILMTSPFAQKLMNKPRVKGAVTKTNVLKKDPNYRTIMHLFEFLRGYQDIGYTIKVVEQNPAINEHFEKDIFHNILFNYLVLKGHLERDKDRQLPAPLKEKKHALKPKFIKEIIEELTEDYDLPDVEIRKVLIEELTKDQLMKEEAQERRRLVEEQAQRRKEEQEKIRQEKAAERERIKQEKAAERERIRMEKEAERERQMIERMEREQEMRRRSKLFQEEIQFFQKYFEDRLDMRKNIKAESEAHQDFEDAAWILEETERLKNEEIQRERVRRREEKERKIREEIELQQRALREAAERKEQERLKLEEQARQERALQREKEFESVSTYIKELAYFRAAMNGRKFMRLQQKEQEKMAQAERDRIRKERAEARKASTKR